MGRLAVGDGPWITGWQGSYCWKGTCADMAGPPHIEKLPSLKPTANDELTFSIDPPEGVFASWSATYSGADGKQHDLARGGSDADPDSTATAPPELLNATFSAPPAGDWTLTVSVRFSVGGDAIYAWHATVA